MPCDLARLAAQAVGGIIGRSDAPLVGVDQRRMKLVGEYRPCYRVVA